MDGFSQLRYYPPCTCGQKNRVVLPVSSTKLSEECLRCEPNYDRVVYYQEAVIPCFSDYKDDATRARATLFSCLRPIVNRDVAKKIAQEYCPNPYDGWTTEDYQKWRKATGKTPAAAVPRAPRRRRVIITREDKMLVNGWFAIISLILLFVLRSLFLYIEKRIFG